MNGHVNQGTIVSLICEVFGARPMAEVEWFNSTTIKMVTNTSRGIEVRTVYELDVSKNIFSISFNRRDITMRKLFETSGGVFTKFCFIPNY